MFSFEIDTESFQYWEDATAIITRMGWNYDEEDGFLFVNAPIEDKNLVEFIFGAFL